MEHETGNINSSVNKFVFKVQVFRFFTIVTNTNTGFNFNKPSLNVNSKLYNHKIKPLAPPILILGLYRVLGTFRSILVLFGALVALTKHPPWLG